MLSVRRATHPASRIPHPSSLIPFTERAMDRQTRVLLNCAAFLALAACHSDSTGPGDGGNPLPPGLTLKFNSFISSGLSAPVFLTQPLNDGRIFVVEQPGRIRVVRDGVLQSTPFLDLTSRVLSGGERGLLSVAFHPQYATNHYFYVYFTTRTNGDIRIERFTATSNPEVADPTSSKLIITIPHSTYANHNGGLLSFGLDGMLYAGVGDGGSGGGPDGEGQKTKTLLRGPPRPPVRDGGPPSISADKTPLRPAPRTAAALLQGAPQTRP